ncbi:hypothetical protein QQ045_019726 [Rhodiola kirilowii]
MGDSTCVMQSFDRSSGHFQRQGDSLHGLGESVSFGRFMTQTLEWEKFSSFNQNRYLEEAQRFAKPGLVAQKKAFFEAHFKKTSSGKGAALPKASNTKNEVVVTRNGVKDESLGAGAGAALLKESNLDTKNEFPVPRDDVIYDKTSSSKSAALPRPSNTNNEVLITGNDGRYEHLGDGAALAKTFNSDDMNEVVVPRIDVRDENLGEPCMDTQSAKSKYGLSINAALSSTDSSSSFDHALAYSLVESQLGEAEEISEFSTGSHPAILVRTDELRSNMAADTPNNVEVNCHQMKSFCDTSDIIKHMVGEPKSIKKSDHPDGLKTELNSQSEVSDNSTILMAICQNKMSTREPTEQFVLASTDDNNPALTSLSTLGSGTKPAVQSRCKPRPLPLPRKENIATENVRAFGNGILNKKRVISMSLHTSINQDYGLQVSKGPLAPKNSDSANRPTNTVRFRDSKGHSDQVVAGLVSQKKLTTTSKTLTTVRKPSAEMYLRPAPPQPKKETTASMRTSLDIRKSTPKPLHMTVGSRAGEKKTLAFFPKVRSDAPAKHVLSDTTNRIKQTIPTSYTSTFGRKSTTRFHAKSAPPLQKNGSRIVQSSSVLPSTQINKSLPKSLHMSVDRSSAVGVKRSMAPRFDDKGSKRPKSRIDDTSNGSKTAVTTIRPPSSTVFTPFRFRSEERAAKRKEKLEEKNKVQAEKHLKINGKHPPFTNVRKTAISKSRETTNHRFSAM